MYTHKSGDGMLVMGILQVFWVELEITEDFK